MTDLLNSQNCESVTIDGRTVSTEEAAMVWETLTPEQQLRFAGLTQLQVVEAVYAMFFDYGFSNTHGVARFELELN